MLSLVFGVSVILYLFDVPIIPQSSQLIPTVSISLPPVVPTTPPVSNVAPSLVPTTAKKLSQRPLITIQKVEEKVYRFLLSLMEL